jgi:hypothetical protein
MRISNSFKVLLALFLFQISYSISYSQTVTIGKYGVEVLAGATIPIGDLKSQQSNVNYGFGLTGMYQDTKINSFFISIAYNRVKVPDSLSSNINIDGVTKFTGGIILNVLPSMNIPFIEAAVGMYYFTQYEFISTSTDNIINGPQFKLTSESKFGYTLGLGQRLPVDKKINLIAHFRFNHMPLKPTSKFYLEFLAGCNYNF